MLILAAFLFNFLVCFSALKSEEVPIKKIKEEPLSKEEKKVISSEEKILKAQNVLYYKYRHENILFRIYLIGKLFFIIETAFT